MTLKTFLDKIGTRPASSILKYVTGNQSADMDSVVSAISYAYFYHQKFPQEAPYLPLVNISRDELKLRRDIVLLLQEHSITANMLCFLDDVEEQTTAKPESKLQVVLVDHCNLQGELLNELYRQKRLSVASIIDHHADEEVFLDAQPRIIHSNGSCSALVRNYWKSQLSTELEPELATLLLGPLLIDTSNMSQKVEAGDKEAFAEYIRVLEESGMAAVNFSSGFFSRLKSAKKDFSGMTFFDILRKDFKRFEFTTASGKTVALGFSSVGKSLSWLLGKFTPAEVLQTFEDMYRTFNLDVIVITSSYTQKKTDIYTREFCYTTREPALENIASEASTLDLDSKIYDFESVQDRFNEINGKAVFKVYNQNNTAASRKQVVPAVKDIIEAMQ